MRAAVQSLGLDLIIGSSLGIREVRRVMRGAKRVRHGNGKSPYGPSRWLPAQPGCCLCRTEHAGCGVSQVARVCDSPAETMFRAPLFAHAQQPSWNWGFVHPPVSSVR